MEEFHEKNHFIRSRVMDMGPKAFEYSEAAAVKSWI